MDQVKTYYNNGIDFKVTVFESFTLLFKLITIYLHYSDNCQSVMIYVQGMSVFNLLYAKFSKNLLYKIELI